MSDSDVIIWENEVVGRLANTRLDMWYLDATWTTSGTQKANEFEQLVSKLKPEEVVKNLSKGVLVQLKENSITDAYYCIVLSIDKGVISMRMINEETATLLKKVKPSWISLLKSYFK